MVVYTIENLLHVKDILKTIPSSFINYTEMQKDNVLEKQQWEGTQRKVEKDEIVLKKVYIAILEEPFFRTSLSFFQF